MKLSNLKLFAVMLGGRTPGCHIELHDIVFVVAEKFEETYPTLVEKWFGVQKKLHVDSYAELKVVDGYEVSLSKQKPHLEQPLYLHCLNFGGYRSGFFGEIHEVQFYVGAEKKEIVKRAKHELCVGTLVQHCDDNLIVGDDVPEKDVDDVLSFNFVDDYYIHLTPTTKENDIIVNPTYRRLDTKDVYAKCEAVGKQSRVVEV